MPNEREIKRHERRILAAIQSMPYQEAIDRGPIEATAGTGMLAMGALADWFEAHAAGLAETRRDEIRTEQELSSLRSDIAASGRVFSAMKIVVAGVGE